MKAFFSALVGGMLVFLLMQSMDARQELQKLKSESAGYASSGTPQPAQSPPLDNETVFSVPVTYVPLPSMEQLEQEFSGAHSVSDIFDGRPFENHPSCVNIDRTPGTRSMLVKHFDQVISS